MTIPTGGLAALLVLATVAVAGCGGDDGADPAPGASAPAAGAAPATQTVTATATATQTTPQASQTTPPSTTTTTKPAQTTKAKTPAATREPATGGDGCGPVEIGVRDGDIELTFARITSRRGVDCQTVTIVAQQWAGERIGLDKALLPGGWECRGTTCTGPQGSFSFTLYKPAA